MAGQPYKYSQKITHFSITLFSKYTPCILFGYSCVIDAIIGTCSGRFLAYLDAEVARGALALDCHLAALLSSSSAAIGIFQDGRLIKHKV